jgi:hypothetical protein
VPKDLCSALTHIHQDQRSIFLPHCCLQQHTTLLLSPSCSLRVTMVTYAAAGALLPPGPQLDLGVLQLLHPRGLWSLLPGLASAAGATLAALRSAASVAGATTPGAKGSKVAGAAGAAAKAAQQQQVLQNQLLQVQGQFISALRALVAALASSPVGLQTLASSRSDIELLMLSLDPSLGPLVASAATADGVAGGDPALTAHSFMRHHALSQLLQPQKPLLPTGKAATQSSPATELTAVLYHVLCMVSAVEAMEAAATGPGAQLMLEGTPPDLGPPVYTLASALTGAAGPSVARATGVLALASNTAAMHQLLRLMRERGRAHRAAFVLTSEEGAGAGAGLPGMPHVGGTHALDLDVDDDPLAGLGMGPGLGAIVLPQALRYSPESLYASAIVLEVRSCPLPLVIE